MYIYREWNKKQMKENKMIKDAYTVKPVLSDIYKEQLAMSNKADCQIMHDITEHIFDIALCYSNQV